MRKYYLCLDINDSELNVSVRTTHPGLDSLRGVRASPIYSTSNPPNHEKPLASGSGCILFCYTLDTFYSLGLIRNTIKEDKNIFVSHGLASVLVFLDDDTEYSKYVSLLGDLAVGWELWKINNGKIIQMPGKAPDIKAEPIPKVPINLLDFENQFVFTEFWTSLNMARATASAYTPLYVDLLEAVRITGYELLFKILYLQKGIDQTTLRKELEAINSDAVSDGKMIEEVIELGETLKDRERFICLHQLKDEAVQLAEILKIFNSQAHGGTSPIAYSTYESGENSLLGIGGAVACLLAAYEHVRRVFSAASLEFAVEFGFPKMHSPPLWSNPIEMGVWRRTLKEYNGIDDAEKPNRYSRRPLAFHIVYFSNRLGYRTTKHTISAAFQSLFLGYLPTHSLCTLTHEYMHAHVSSLLASLYPLAPRGGGAEIPFSQLNELYVQMFSNRGYPKNPTALMQALIMWAVHHIFCIENCQKTSNGQPIQKAFDEETIFLALRKWHHEVDEVIVHILDYHYFYRTDPDVYIKAIWLSWMALPFLPSRIREYLLRTICAVSSNQTGRPEERFTWCIRQIHTSLEELSHFPLFQKAEIQMVLRSLDDPVLISDMRNKFVCGWCPLVDATVHYLVSSQVQTALTKEFEEELQEDASYSYDLPRGTFEQRRIESPVAFMLEQLKLMLADRSDQMQKEDAEYYTLWMLTAVSSAMNNKTR